jgi:protein SCO1/2
MIHLAKSFQVARLLNDKASGGCQPPDSSDAILQKMANDVCDEFANCGFETKVRKGRIRGLTPPARQVAQNRGTSKAGALGADQIRQTNFAWRIAFCIITLVAFLALPSPAAAQRFTNGPAYGTPAGQSPTAELLGDVGIEQHLDAQLPLDTAFRDEAGREVRLGDYFHDKPVVVALVYYRCPMLCTQVLNGFLKCSQAVPLQIGRDYEVVTVSFDPTDTPDMAAEKKKNHIRAYRRDGAEAGWHFLTGDQASIDKLAQTIGFRYRYDAPSSQFAHASGIVIATPEGRLSRYLYGIEYTPRDLQLGLVDSSSGKIGSPVDQVLLLCYHYDPLTGRYGLAISGLLRTAGLLTMFGLGLFLFRMYRLERSRPKLVRPIGQAATAERAPVLELTARELP